MLRFGFRGTCGHVPRKPENSIFQKAETSNEKWFFLGLPLAGLLPAGLRLPETFRRRMRTSGYSFPNISLKTIMEDNTKNVLQGLLIGASLGVLAGILLAPSSGKDTRRKISDSTKDLKTKVGSQLEDTMNKASQYAESTIANLKKTAKSENISNN